MITVTLPYPISANRYWATRIFTPKDDTPGKKCDKCGHTHSENKPRALTYVTPEAKAFKEEVGWILKSKGVRQALKGRVQVDIQMYPHRPLDYKKRMRDHGDLWDDSVMRLDLDNARKVVNDALKEVAFADDKCIFKDSGEVMEPDGREACLVVTIRPYQRAGQPEQPSLLLEEVRQDARLPAPIPEGEAF